MDTSADRHVTTKHSAAGPHEQRGSNRWARRLGWLLAVVVFCGCAVSVATAAGGKPDAAQGSRDATTSLTEKYIWHDGERVRTIWLNPGLFVEFDSSARNRRVIGQMYPQAKSSNASSEREHGVRIWRVEPVPGVDARQMVQTLATQVPGARFSPVFHDGPSPESRMRAMPGNVIVYPRQRWTAEQAGRWAAAHDLEIVRFLDIGPGVVVVRSAPGLAALELANDLSKRDNVSAAFPDWWQEAVLR
jgi:hypothetical protein